VVLICLSELRETIAVVCCVVSVWPTNSQWWPSLRSGSCRQKN